MYERVELKNGCCPDCGGDRYWEGPSGGASVNICCMGCLSAFNIGPGNFAERIPNTHFVQGGAKAIPPFMARMESTMNQVGLSAVTERGRWPDPQPTPWMRFKRWLGL